MKALQDLDTSRLTARDVRGLHFPVRAFFGHHKCATGWIDSILMEACFHLGVRFRIVHTPDDFRSYGTLRHLVAEQNIDVLAYTNADLRHVTNLPFHRGFHVVRDPRDVLVSAYFSHLYSHGTENWPELEAHRNELRNLSKGAGLLCELEFSRDEFTAMYEWDYEQENVLELKMEDLIEDPVGGFTTVFRFLEILVEDDPGRTRDLSYRLKLRMNRLNERGRRFMPRRLPVFPVPRQPVHFIPEWLLRKILTKKSFGRLSGGRRRGQENLQSHYRKGVPGDWRNHLEVEHIRAFKSNHNDLLLKLGYETDANWS